MTDDSLLATDLPFIALNFVHDVGWSGTKAASFFRDGASRVKVTFDYDGRQEIGVYETRIREAKVLDLHRALLASRYREIPTRKIMPPGTKSVLFEVQVENQPRLLTGFELPSMPSSIVPVVAAFNAALEEVRAHPKSVVRGEARWNKNPVSSGDDLLFTLTLANPGRDNAVVGHPLGPWASLKLLLRPAQGREADAVPLGRDDAADARSAGTEDGITLAPGGSPWSASMRKHLQLAPGRHEAVLVYRTHVPNRTHLDVEGELPIKLPDLTVVGAR